MSAPEIVTFGCRLNAFESKIIRDHVRGAGLTDTIVFNTCTVTAEAERQARQAIRKARRKRPDARIIVTGCAAQIDPLRFAAMEEVDQVLGNAEKLRAESYRAEAAPPILVDDVMTARESAHHLVSGFDGRARAFVQIQQGCDHRCTFCIIPFARGPNRSVPAERIVEQVHGLVADGIREVVLTGVDITDYGLDLADRPSLGRMVRTLLREVPDLPRLRLTSLDAAEVDDELLAVLADEPRLMPHIHVSAQSGDDMILKRMKRRHSRAHLIQFCDRVRDARTDAVFGADLIAGFPTETEQMFDNSVSLVDECGLTHLHVFPYSERPGTPAARMPQVPVPVRKQRAALLREAGERRLKAYLDGRRGATVRVLVETARAGRCEHYARVALDRDASPGEIVTAVVERRENTTLSARLVR
jgi:threonylcarbamoyladenosine tRNA methylthiotransferase MtaB